MINTLSVLFFFFPVITSYAQKPVIDLEMEKKFISQKSKHYQQLYLAEQQITANQEEFDVKYYSLELIPNPATSFLTGQVEVVAEVLGPSLTHVELNFWDGMNITDIHRKYSPGVQLSFTHSRDLLLIDLDSTFIQGEEFNVVIAYNGRPQNSDDYSFDFGHFNGKPIIGTLSEPFGARTWWPCKDIASDKADSVDIRVTVPNDLIVASNGTLRETSVEGDLSTYWWHEQYPIATYLVSIAIHPYTVYYDDYLYNDDADTMKIHFYVFQDNYDRFFAINALVKDMLSYFSEIFGQYPFIEEKYGHADYLLGGAMEHQTCSSFAFWGESVYAHELAHQWWGDMVTCQDFHHIWLNEGFATYSEALWFEHAYPGGITASEFMMHYRLYQGAGTVYLEDPLTESIFDGGLTYNKAAWVLHMLRHVVGNDVFFDILKTYGSSEEHKFGSANTSEFQEICEQVSGLNLDKFFSQWIYQEYYPHYRYGWNLKEVEGGYQIKLGIDQIQENTVLFWMPIDVRISTNSYDTTFVVWDSLESHTFEFFLDEEPLNIEIDPDDWILKDTELQLLVPYATNITLNNSYLAPGIDTLLLTCETENPDQESLELEATIESLDLGLGETLTMYDDGAHGDSAASDGIYSATWPVPGEERSYTVHVKTLSTKSGYYNTLQDAALFTTTGPVVLSSYNIVSEDTIANPGDFIGFEFTISNIGLTDTVYNLLSKVISSDSCANIVAFSDPLYGDIAPGENAVASRVIRIRFDEECSAPAQYSFSLEIYSDSHLFWREEFMVYVVTGLPRENLVQPKEFLLNQNYPNPFNPITVISYQLPVSGNVELSIYSILGEKVVTLLSKSQNSGNYDVEWDAAGFASGVYYYKIQAGEFQDVKKMILLR
jgi:aminopeptidase N